MRTLDMYSRGPAGQFLWNRMQRLLPPLQDSHPWLSAVFKVKVIHNLTLSCLPHYTGFLPASPTEGASEEAEPLSPSSLLGH